MKTTLSILAGFALAASMISLQAQQGPGPKHTGGQGGTNAPCGVCPSGGGAKACPHYGQGQGKGQGKGFRGGPRDGSGPRRDGSGGGGKCPNAS